MLLDKPAPDELEISIFGPGVGECVVVHLGGGSWLIADSCLNPSTRRPAALEYLRDVGVRVETEVAAVVVTHWHDDHTRGVSQVLDACDAAEFHCSAALRRMEFFELVSSASQLKLQAGSGSGVDEMAQVFEVLRRRRTGQTSRLVSPRYAAENTVLYRRASSGGLPACTVEALSPSSMSQTRAFVGFAPVLKAPKRAIPNPGPNELSVALHIEFGASVALLGADLEIGSSIDVGWRAVVRNGQRPSAKAMIVKVPHHGSEGADHDPMWTTMVDPVPHVGVTPFHSSRLPRPEDIERLRRRTPHVLHASPRAARVARFDPTTERTLEGIKVRERVGELGHVRFRVRNGGPVTYDLAGAARAV
jgi:beta-lactamase superfamily II metal-dependent hydrolase